ncbi:MAG: sodium:solute symporter family protein [Vulcanimicrobiaceae bacterium]
MNAVLSLTVVGAIVLATVTFALFSIRHVTMSPREFIVGNRSFGALFLWVLLAGEIYTSFTFLGAAGWAYGLGAPAFYILAYGTCGYIIGYFLLPAIWRIGKERGLLTSPDFFVARYGSRTLGTVVAIVQFVLVVPYVTLQLSGLQILLKIAGYGAIDGRAAAVISFVVITLFVFATGLRGTAWASIVKDTLVIGALIFVGIAIPIQFFGSPAAMFDQLLRAHPTHLLLAPGSANHGEIWYVSTVLLTGIGFFMGPHSIAATYSARDGDTLRRNAVFLPLYQLVLLLVFFAGFAALLIVPGLKGPSADQSFMLVVQRFYPPWVLGFVVGAGALCALVPASALLLGAASLISKNVLGDALGIATSDRNRLLTTRILVVLVGLLSLGLWLTEDRSLVSLLLVYYNGVTQFMPAFVFGFLWRRTTVWGVSAGIAGGLALAAYLAFNNLQIWGANPGFLALGLNIVLLVGVSLCTRPPLPSPDPV